MNRNYYKQLCHKYFEATLSPREERRLMAYLSSTEDPAFDEVKAVASFFAQGRAIQQANTVRRRPWRAVFSAGIAASLIIAVSLAMARKQSERDAEAIASMESTLAAFFSSGTDFETELTDLFNQ